MRSKRCFGGILRHIYMEFWCAFYAFVLLANGMPFNVEEKLHYRQHRKFWMWQLTNFPFSVLNRPSKFTHLSTKCVSFYFRLYAIAFFNFVPFLLSFCFLLSLWFLSECWKSKQNLWKCFNHGSKWMHWRVSMSFCKNYSNLRIALLSNIVFVPKLIRFCKCVKHTSCISHG